jgi:GTPase SAR1 family protein
MNSASSDVSAGDSSAAKNDEIVSDIIDLPRGKELTEAAALRLAHARPVRWIVVAGSVGAGKTTLLTSLFELFQWNKVPKYVFAGSETLPAFEERCHLSRIESDGEEEDTKRTVYEEVPKYLHLRVAPQENTRNQMDFLFTDVSGEMFEHVRDSTIACQELSFLRRAGNLILLLDSKKALHAEKRWAIVEDAKSILRSCLDSKMLTPTCVVTILWSRFDYFVEAKDTAEQQSFRNQVVEQFRAAFQKRIPHLKFSELAARPIKARNLGFGMGSIELLDAWVTFCPSAEPLNLLPKISGTRESERFVIRHFGSL